MLKFLTQMFTWWNGQTVNTRFYTWRHGAEVGRDEAGNVYYQGELKDTEGRNRRWVIYAGASDASRIPPGWFGWMQHRTDVAPSAESYVARDWEKTHQPNLTGTPQAYRPKGSLLSGSHRPQVTGDYDAWTPGG